MLFVVVHMIDSLLNTVPIAATPLIGGMLVASYLAGGTRTSGPTGARRPVASVPIALVVTLIVLAVVEIIGRLPRSSPPGDPPRPAAETPVVPSTDLVRPHP